MPFVPGKSGNPEGRRAEDRKLKLLARQHTEKAVATLARYLESENPQAAIAAANALLDRAFGRPKQTVEGHVTYRRRLSYAKRLEGEAVTAPDNSANVMVNTVQ